MMKQPIRKPVVSKPQRSQQQGSSAVATLERPPRHRDPEVLEQQEQGEARDYFTVALMDDWCKP